MKIIPEEDIGSIDGESVQSIVLANYFLYILWRPKESSMYTFLLHESGDEQNLLLYFRPSKVKITAHR